jgi:hypothetical protein
MIDAEDIIAKIGTWIFNELKLKELMQTALKANTLQHVSLFFSFHLRLSHSKQQYEILQP